MALVGPVSRRSLHKLDDDFEYPMIDNLPLHWDLLTRNDLDSYVELRKSFYDEIRKSKKGEKLDAFVQRLVKIKYFVERGDADDWKRGLVCGILFLENGIAIHIQQFRLLLGKCKSSINGSLQAIGFVAHPQGGPIEKELYQKVPIFQKEHSEVKKWTVRDCTAPVNPFKRNPITIPQIKEIDSHENKLNLQIEQKCSYNTRSSIDMIGKESIVPNQIPCYMAPIKFRYKYYNLLHQNIAIQTGI